MGTVKELKALAPGDTASFRACVLRLWEIGGLRMALVGDETGLMRVELGEAQVEEGKSYEFRGASVQQYPGGWTSVSIAKGGRAVAIEHVDVPQDEAYIERTYKILSGVQRKKGRREGRLPAWRHPSSGG
jgi:hypothetical protein